MYANMCVTSWVFFGGVPYLYPGPNPGPGEVGGSHTRNWTCRTRSKFMSMNERKEYTSARREDCVCIT